MKERVLIFSSNCSGRIRAPEFQRRSVTATCQPGPYEESTGSSIVCSRGRRVGEAGVEGCLIEKLPRDGYPNPRGVIPNLREVIPETLGVILKLREVIPNSRGVTPKTRGVIPKTSEVIPRTWEVIPRTWEVIPKTRGVIPAQQLWTYSGAFSWISSRTRSRPSSSWMVSRSIAPCCKRKRLTTRRQRRWRRGRRRLGAGAGIGQVIALSLHGGSSPGCHDSTLG
jgi:hypothetical protein